MGNALATRGRWNEAIAALRKAVEADPRDAKSWWRLGEAYEIKGFAPQAAECFRKADDLSPMGTREQRKDTLASGTEDDLDRLIVGMKKAVEADPKNFETFKALGTAYSRKGLHDEALYYLRKALSLQPRDADIVLGLGMAHDAKGEEATALAMYEKAVGLHPENALVCMAAAERFISRGAYDKVLDCYRHIPESALKGPDVARMKSHQAQAHQARKEYDKAVACYEWLVREGGPEGARACRELALCAQAAGDFEKMLRFAHEALLRDPQDAGLRRCVADHHFGLGRYDEAMPHYQVLVDIAPADSEVLSRLAAIYMNKSQSKPEDAP